MVFLTLCAFLDFFFIYCLFCSFIHFPFRDRNESNYLIGSKCVAMGNIYSPLVVRQYDFSIFPFLRICTVLDIMILFD